VSFIRNQETFGDTGLKSFNFRSYGVRLVCSVGGWLGCWRPIAIRHSRRKEKASKTEKVDLASGMAFNLTSPPITDIEDVAEKQYYAL